MNPIRAFAKSIYRGIVNALPDEPAVQLLYFRAFRRFVNMKAPRTYNEKMNWRKVHQRDPRFPVFADKIAVKDEIARLVGPEHVIPTLWTGTDPDAIPFADLEPPYVVKVSHSSGGNLFVRTAADLDPEAIRASLREQLAYRHERLFREWVYAEIPARILIERMLVEPGDRPPDDYKFITFHGKVRIIEVDSDRFGDYRQMFLDPGWQQLPFKKEAPLLEEPPPRPANLDRMIALAERIGGEFDFVRVDLYDSVHGIFFGETTFFPGAGIAPFFPDSWDRTIGDYWITHEPK